jgi:hypothetical protein
VINSTRASEVPIMTLLVAQALHEATKDDIKGGYTGLIFIGLFFLALIFVGIWWLKRQA